MLLFKRNPLWPFYKIKQIQPELKIKAKDKISNFYSIQSGRIQTKTYLSERGKAATFKWNKCF